MNSQINILLFLGVGKNSIFNVDVHNNDLLSGTIHFLRV